MPKEKSTSFPTDEEWAERNAEQEIELAARKELAPLVESPALNKMLLKNARKSLADISKLTGIPVDEVSERLTVLTESGSWRDDLQEEKLLLLEVGLLVDDIRTRMGRLSVEDEGWASMARVQLAALKTLMEQVDKRRKAIDGKLALVTLQQASMMVEAFKMARDGAILSLKKKYPELDEEILYAEFDDALIPAIEYVNSKASDD